MLFRMAALFWLVPTLSTAASCAASTLVLHCVSRCAGLNATSMAASDPPPEQVLAPQTIESLAPDTESLPVKGRRTFSLFAQLGEASGRVAPSAANFSDQSIYTPAHRAFSPEQLMALLGPARSLEWTPIAAARFGCVDGRHASSGLYAYGGDLGEFALGMSVLEHVTQREIGQAETTRLLEAWLHTLAEAGGGFGACVDAAAVAQLASAVGIGSEPLDLANPPEEVRAQLMLRIIAPEFVGSDHIKWLLLYPKKYATRTRLVEQSVRAYFGVLWNAYHPSRKALTLDVLAGARAERAVVHVHASHWCASEQRLAPALPTKTRGGSMLVYQPDAVAARREALVAQLAGSVTPPVERAELLGRVQTLGEGQAALTEKAIAGMLRGYSLTVK